MKSESRIAFVIDALPGLGGAEKVLFTAMEIFPEADIFSLLYNQRLFTDTPLANRRVTTSFIDHLPYAHRQHRPFLPLMPLAVEHFDLRNYETIISFSYAVAHGVKISNGAHHVSYTFTPMRYAWTDLNPNGTHTSRSHVMNQMMKAFRKWDTRSALSVHTFAAISQAVARRIQNAYQRDAELIYPPVDVDRFRPAQTRENFYITVTRLVPHKRIDILVQAFSQTKLPLLVVGDGPEMPRLARNAGSNIHFLGYQPDEKVVELLGKARGFICATEEDFGIAIVEAQASGCPVIALGRGGALETVIEGQTGLFFTEQSAESLIEALEKFERLHSQFQVSNLVQNSRKFHKNLFTSQFKQLILTSQSNSPSPT